MSENWAGDEHVGACLEEDIVRHELVCHLGENLGLQGEVFRFARLSEGEWDCREDRDEHTIFPWEAL